MGVELLCLIYIKYLDDYYDYDFFAADFTDVDK